MNTPTSSLLAPKPLLLAASAVAMAVALLLAPLGTLAQAPAANEKANAPKPALTVTVDAPSRATWSQTLSANGNVAAWQEASVGAEANGLRLAEVRAQVGDRVKAGQVLAVFDAEGVRAEVAQSRAALAEARAERHVDDLGTIVNSIADGICHVFVAFVTAGNGA